VLLVLVLVLLVLVLLVFVFVFVLSLFCVSVRTATTGPNVLWRISSANSTFAALIANWINKEGTGWASSLYFKERWMRDER